MLLSSSDETGTYHNNHTSLKSSDKKDEFLLEVQGSLELTLKRFIFIHWCPICIPGFYALFLKYGLIFLIIHTKLCVVKAKHPSLDILMKKYHK